MKARLLLTILALATAPALGQSIDPSALVDTDQILAWKILAKQGIDHKNIRKKAQEQLASNVPFGSEPIYDFQRVEFTGIWSADDADKDFPGMFDKRIQPSFFNDHLTPPNNPIDKAGAVLEKISDRSKDLRALYSDRNGELSPRAKDELKSLENKEINQLVCHSWGTEIVYEAIFEGLIKPPREIFILAPTDPNIEKWRVLARKTGAIVHVRQGADDLAIKSSGLIKTKIPPSPVEIQAAWNARAEAIDYDPHWRARSGVAQFDYRNDMATGGHQREGYYRPLMAEHGLLSSKVSELAAPQEARITLERDRMFNDAQAQAQDLITRMRGEFRESRSLYAGLRQGEAGDARKAAQAVTDDTAEAIRHLEEVVSRAEETRAREAEEKRALAAWLEKGGTFRYLASVVGMACENPGSFSTEVGQGMHRSVGMDRAYLSSFLAEIYAGNGVTGCQDSLLRQILNSTGPVSGPTLLGWADQYRRAHPTMVQRASRALAEFANAATSFARSNPDLSGAGGTSERKDRSGQAPSGGVTMKEGQAMGQLRGINLNGW